MLMFNFTILELNFDSRVLGLLILNCDTPYVLLEDSGESPEIETKWVKMK